MLTTIAATNLKMHRAVLRLDIIGLVVVNWLIKLKQILLKMHRAVLRLDIIGLV